jgi:hypothetical protein
MNDRTANTNRMQSEILGERVANALLDANFQDLSEARDATRYAMRIEFAQARVEELRASASQRQSLFEDARLGVALTILESHVVQAACFIDRIARRQSGALGEINRKIAGETMDASDLEEVRAVRAA